MLAALQVANATAVVCFRFHAFTRCHCPGGIDVTPPPLPCESNALIRATAGVVSATFGTTHIPLKLGVSALYIPSSCISSPCNLLFLNLGVYGVVQATAGVGTVLVWDLI